MSSPCLRCRRLPRIDRAVDEGAPDRGSVTPLVIGMMVCLLLLTAGVTAAGSAFLAGQRLQRFATVLSPPPSARSTRTGRRAPGSSVADPVAAANEYLRVRGPDVGAVITLGAETRQRAMQQRIADHVRRAVRVPDPGADGDGDEPADPPAERTGGSNAGYCRRDVSPGRDPDMRPSLRWRLAACALLVGTIVAGCTTSTADDPTSTVPSGTASPSVVDTSPASPVSSVPASPSPSVIDASTPPTSPTTLDPEAQEIADRAAVEAQWVKFWDAVTRSIRNPPAERDAQRRRSAVDPNRSQMLDDATISSSRN